MSRLEDLKPDASVRGIIPNSFVTVINVKWFGQNAIELTYRTPDGRPGNILLYRDAESSIEVVQEGRAWCFDGDGAIFRLVSEAHRIHLAHLFDPVLAVHSSVVDPLPHQITAVYDTMLPRQPLRFLLADDPGAGKTIMAGLLMKELIVRGDLQRCLVVCPGSLAEQWQDELQQRFQLPFEIMTNDKLEAARTGNWFSENNLVIARLDKLSRNENVQEKLKVPECHWDLVICDEAHKMSASFFGGDIHYTKRYKLGQLLSSVTRHFLLMTATPHNGKEEDFQLFMALLDGDRFEGRFRDGAHAVDVSDLMRRMVKENLYKFDGTPLFPERIAYTVPYKLSNLEAQLYKEVTGYVREEFNRAEALQNGKRTGAVGFALTILQRRLASSPEAIAKSLENRKKRLESLLKELELLQRGGPVKPLMDLNSFDVDDIDELDDIPDVERAKAEEEVLDQATASVSLEELRAEIATLKRLEKLAESVRSSGEDTKWRELSSLLMEIFAPPREGKLTENQAHCGSRDMQKHKASPNQKLVIFTEHRATLDYLEKRISTLLGSEEAVVTIHGSKGREERLKTQEIFKHDPNVKVLIATDAAGEGINLQRAHLMINYDLPWNPNRIEQRFGRIHRIGQTEVCYLWNLVAEETREGDVYLALLEKLEQARTALGGQVFDVLGKLQFNGKPLRELLIEAIRYAELPEVRERLTKVVADAFDREHLQDLLDERALVHDNMDVSRVQRIREDMERAEARRLQPHYIESFFLEAFRRLGGNAIQREAKRYEIKNVPASIRNRDRLIGIGEPVLQRYERITFEKSLIAASGKPLAAFICPGHPLLSSIIDIILEQHRDVLRSGSILVDEKDMGIEPRLLFYLEHSVQDASLTSRGEQRVISKRMLYVEMDKESKTKHLQYAPYLDYRPLASDEPDIRNILAQPECAWIDTDLEQEVYGYAIANVVPEHITEVRERKLKILDKTEIEVKARLTKEITYWDSRSIDLKDKEQAGKTNAKLNSDEARKRADDLEGRLRRRMNEIEKEKQISALPPLVIGSSLLIPIGLIRKIMGVAVVDDPSAVDTQAAGARAREIVMDLERGLGFEPVDREFEKLGYDIESRIPDSGRLRFIEVKGRVSGAKSITVTRNEVLYSLNKPEDHILAIVEFMPDNSHKVHYLRAPFSREPDFGVTSVNYDFSELLKKAELPS